MQPKYDNPKHVVKHFNWLSDRTFKAINNDSLEKIFEITPDNKLRTLGYGSVPMLTFSDETLNEKYHFYRDRKHTYINEENILSYTLIRKIQ